MCIMLTEQIKNIKKNQINYNARANNSILYLDIVEMVYLHTLCCAINFHTFIRDITGWQKLNLLTRRSIGINWKKGKKVMVKPSNIFNAKWRINFSIQLDNWNWFQRLQGGGVNVFFCGGCIVFIGGCEFFLSDCIFYSDLFCTGPSRMVHSNNGWMVLLQKL